MQLPEYVVIYETISATISFREEALLELKLGDIARMHVKELDSVNVNFFNVTQDQVHIMKCFLCWWHKTCCTE